MTASALPSGSVFEVRHLLLVTASLSALAGCASIIQFDDSITEHSGVTVTTKLTDRKVKLPRICRDGVALLTPFDKVGPDYREIAHLEASGDANKVGNTKLYTELRHEAASFGANAIIVNKVSDSNILGQFVAQIIHGTEVRVASATAIYFAADSQRVRMACARKH
jgi:uncharacterized protein YceK